MANPTPTVTDYCGVLARSRLLPPDRVSTLLAEWKAADGADAQVDAFRRFLVAGRHLTEYQAALVGRGYADGFFIGGYQVLDRIGKGQTAGVYKAVHPSGQVVAIKVLPASKAKNPHLLGRFQREGRLLTQLNHPNVVRAFQVGSAKDGTGAQYIAMEHLDGETLDEVLARRKRLPPPEAARLVYQALQGLHHLHGRRMVHRDLKPANLMVTPPPPPGGPDTTLNATLKILDIGLGRELFDDGGAATRDMNLTAEGAILGTPDYLAPEQARDARGADVRADIYSLGCVFFHLMAGRPPFVEKNVMAVMVRHASEPPPAIAGFAPGAAGLQAVLNRMMAKDPAARYPTPAEAAEAVRPFLPTDAPEAVGSSVLPAYEAWLAAEGSADAPPPGATPGPIASPLARSRPNGSGAAAVRIESGPPAGSGGVPASATSRAPATAPTAGPPAIKVPRPTVSGPASGKIQRPPGLGGPPAGLSGPPSGKLRVGPGLGGSRGAAPSPLKPPSAARPSPLPPAPEIDVELVVLPNVRPPEAVDVLEKVVAGPPPRPLWELDRRDFLMLGMGAGGTLAAIVAGLVMARANSGRLRGGEPDEQKANQP